MASPCCSQRPTEIWKEDTRTPPHDGWMSGSHCKKSCVASCGHAAIMGQHRLTHTCLPSAHRPFAHSAPPTCNIPYLRPLVKASSSLLSQPSQRFFRETFLSFLSLGFLILVTVIFRQTCLQMLMSSFHFSPQSSLGSYCLPKGIIGDSESWAKYRANAL